MPEEEKEKIENPPTGAEAKTDKTLENPEADASVEPAAETAAAAPSAEEKLSEVEEKLRKVEEKLSKAEKESENIRRRADKEVREAHQRVLKKFVPELGDVYDCLEKSLEVEDGGEKTREGVELTLRKLKDVMDMYHISPIRPEIGAQFDPTMHMAIGMSPPTDAAPDDTVAVVTQPGYMISGQVTRPAKVMVSQALPDKADKTE